MIEKDISLFPHNEDGYTALCESIEEYPLAFLEHATGTGKSFILLKFLYKKMRQKRILFISMHEEMFSQLFDEQMPSLGLDKEKDFYKFDTLIYHNILKQNMENLINNYDCFVFDEAHHCGAEKWSEKVKELKELVLKTKGKIMIGATATRIRYLDDYLDVAEEFFDGKVVSHLPVSKSILKNLLPAPLYINSLKSCADLVDKLISKISKVSKTAEILEIKARIEKIKEQVNEESEIKPLLKKYDVKPGEKYIVFCKSIEDLNQKMAEAESWFEDIGPIKTFQAHSNQKKEKNMSEIKEFSQKRNEISLMFAVDIFNEGFHISGVDGVFMFRKTKSPIIYFQQLGRALSFSVRKNQIKIFDFVDNISENEVIYELYKEIIEEARKLTIENPANKELYESILSRFQIIDHTTSVLDELKEIERFLNENYIFKNILNNAIMKLEEYRSFYPTSNFTEELINNRLSPDYKKAYEYICKNSDILTQEQIERINKLNIYFNIEINMPGPKRIALLNGHKNIADLKNTQYKQFIKEYIDFVIKNNHRPTYSNNEHEFNLNRQYRTYLEEFTPSKISKMISNFPFKSTAEEIVLTGNYPEKSDIEQYLYYIETKIIKGIPLDSIEVKVIKKIEKTISLKEARLLELLNNIDDIAYKIESSIEIIKRYKQLIDPEERFENIVSLSYNKEVYKAIRIIHKNAKRVTNPQFEKLIALNIKLPKELDKTLEERLEELGPYNSIYEKEKSQNIGILNDFIIFVVQNSRRPTSSNEEELFLAKAYEEHLKKSNSVKVREICSILKQNRIPLTFYEKVIIGDYIEPETIDNFIKEAEQRLVQTEIVDEEDLKIIRAIERHSYKKSITYLDELRKNIIQIRELDEDITRLENDFKNKKELNSYIIRKISNNQKYLTKKQIARLLNINIIISDEIITEINSLEYYVNIAHKETVELSIFIKEYKSYLEKNKKHPSPDSEIYKKYRHYLANLSPKKAVSLLKEIASKGIQLSLEERVILNEYSLEEPPIKEYIENIKSKEKIDSLEKRILNILTKKTSTSKEYDTKNEIKKLSKKTLETDEETTLLASLISSIHKNPHVEINFANSIYKISNANQRKLEKIRETLLAKEFIGMVLIRIKNRKTSLKNCLTEEEFKKYMYYASLNIDDEDYLFNLNMIKNLNSSFSCLEAGIIKAELINEYIRFIKEHHGKRPNINSQNETEYELALDFQKMLSKIDSKEYALIEKTIKEATDLGIKENLYQQLYNFIISNGRFPCGNSDNKDEVYLNNLYISYNDTFTKEQLTELRKLKKTYGRATLEANMEFARQAKEKSIKK